MHLFKKKSISNPYQYVDTNCIICNSNNLFKKDNTKFTTEVCANCTQLGFISKTSYPSRIGNKQIIELKNITGIISHKKLIHTFYLGKEVSKQIQLYFLTNLKQLNAEGIFWVDESNKEQLNISLKILASHSSLPVRFTVRTIPELLKEFKNDPSCSYLNKDLRNEIIQMAYSENSGLFKKAAYSTDILRIIALLLHGGLYLDTNTRISAKSLPTNDEPIFGARYIAIDCPTNFVVYNDYYPLSNIDYGREATEYASQKLNLPLKPNLYTKEHDNYYFANNPKITVRPECSAILGNKGALFFDLVLYDMLDKFKLRNKTYKFFLDDQFSKNKNESIFKEFMNTNLSKSINSRNPIIINSMMLAQRFIMLKVNNFDEKHFYFDKCEMSGLGLKKELDALGYKGAVFFNIHGHRFIKYYSHSHKSVNLPTSDSANYERYII